MPESKIIRLKVDEELADSRADVGLTQLGILSTRSQIKKLFDYKKILANNEVIKPSYILQEHDELTIEIKEENKEELLPYDIPLDIVFEDDEVIVVNKPAGLVVHPACGHKNDTLINGLIAHQKTLSNGSSPYRPGLVHRIDKDTSGLLVLAKNEKSHSHLAKQFERKTTHRIYEAIIFGHLKDKTGTIDTFITRSPNDRKKFKVVQEEVGKKAITHFEVLRESHHFSLIQLKLETGRTHQIRVHLSSVAHPIVGDDTYGGKKPANNLQSQKAKKYIQNMNRFALHAKELGFVHPKTNKRVTFSVDWPEDLSELFEITGLST